MPPGLPADVSILNISPFDVDFIVVIPVDPMRSLSVGVSLLTPCPMIKLPEPSLSIRLSNPPLGTDTVSYTHLTLPTKA